MRRFIAWAFLLCSCAAGPKVKPEGKGFNVSMSDMFFSVDPGTGNTAFVCGHVQGRFVCITIDQYNAAVRHNQENESEGDHLDQSEHPQFKL